jgi:arsenite methyltransferase
MPRPRGNYGLDAPAVPAVFAAVALVAFAVALVVALAGGGTAWGWLVAGVVWLAFAAVYLHTTRRGKFAVWSDILDGLHLRGDERVLDMGCGRGAVLLLAAQRLRAGGEAVGVDLWRAVDQSGNAEEATLANARAEGVADRVELHTGDMSALPFPDGSFDVVLSSLAIHNIPSAAGRAAAVDEAARVVRPGGRVALADIRHARGYATRLRERGLDVHTRGLGWRFWYGGPWVATTLVTATRPVNPR